MNIKAKITPVALAIALAAGFGLPLLSQCQGLQCGGHRL